MTEKDFESQPYRMTTSASNQVPEEDFFDREAAYDSWEEQTGSGGTGFRRYWALFALLVIALIGIYVIYKALRPRENSVRLSQATVIDSRIDELELRLAKLEDDALETNQSANMTDQSEVVDSLAGRIDRLENSFKTWVEETAAKKETAKAKPVVQAKPKKPVAPVKKKPTVPAKAVKKEPQKPAVVKKEPPPPASGTGRFHTVLPEENLYRISLKYNLTVDRLMELNNLQTNTIRSGQKLRVSP